MRIFPGIQSDKMDAVFQYGDGVSDDHRMALMVVLDAQERGLDLRSYCEAQVLKEEEQEVVLQLWPSWGEPRWRSCQSHFSLCRERP